EIIESQLPKFDLTNNEKNTDLYIHRFIKSRYGTDRTLLLLHGTGGDENDLIPIAKHIDSTANILSLRGDVNENGTLRFFKRFAFGIFDERDLIERANKLTKFIKFAAKKYNINLEKLTIIGFSNGANFASAAIFLDSSIFKNAILFRAMVPYFRNNLADLSDKNIFMLAGKFDRFVTTDNTEQL